MANNHTGVYPGKRVRVVLRDGTEIAGKFIGKASRFTVIGGNGFATRIANAAIKSLQLEKHLHKPAGRDCLRDGTCTSPQCAEQHRCIWAEQNPEEARRCYALLHD